MLLPSTRSRRRTTFTAVTGLSVACAALVTACAPGAASSSAPPSQPASTAVGSAKVTINVEEASIDVPLFQKLGTLFTAKYPNITVNVTGQDFNTLQTNVPRILTGSNVPDIIRLGAFGNTIADKQLTNLDPYAATYGWNGWPQAAIHRATRFPGRCFAVSGSRSGRWTAAGPGTTRRRDSSM